MDDCLGGDLTPEQLTDPPRVELVPGVLYVNQVSAPKNMFLIDHIFWIGIIFCDIDFIVTYPSLGQSLTSCGSMV